MEKSSEDKLCFICKNYLECDIGNHTKCNGFLPEDPYHGIREDESVNNKKS